MRSKTAFLVLLSLAGCKKKSGDGALLVTGPEAIPCGALVPASTRVGFNMHGTRPDGVLTCEIEKKHGDVHAKVTFNCAPWTTLQDLRGRQPAGATVIADIGRLGWRVKDSAVVYASKADCELDVDRLQPDAMDPTEIARAVDGAVTKKNAPDWPKPPPGTAGLHCDRYVPQGLRDAHKLTVLKQTFHKETVECTWSGDDGSLTTTLSCFLAKRDADAMLNGMKTALTGNTPLDAGTDGFQKGGTDAAFIASGTSCAVHLVSSVKGLDLVDAAKQIAGAVTPVSIK